MPDFTEGENAGSGHPGGNPQQTTEAGDEAEDKDSEETAETAAASTGIALSEVDADTWKLMGVTAAVLLAGLGFAIIYRKR